VLGWIDAKVLQRLQIQLLDVDGRGLEHDLVLVIVLKPVGIVAVAAVLGAARRLHIGGAPRLGPDGAQEGRGMEGARADFHVVRLQQHAAMPVPEFVEAQDELLEGKHEGSGILPGRLLAQMPARSYHGSPQ
jgi:hypothetical protein